MHLTAPHLPSLTIPNPQSSIGVSLEAKTMLEIGTKLELGMKLEIGTKLDVGTNWKL